MNPLEAYLILPWGLHYSSSTTYCSSCCSFHWCMEARNPAWPLKIRKMPGLVYSSLLQCSVAYYLGELERWTYFCCWDKRLAKDYLLTSWDPDFFRWPWEKEDLGDLCCWVN